MERIIIQLPPFSRYLDELIAEGKLSKQDFEEFENFLIKNPQAMSYQAYQGLGRFA